MFFSSIRDVRLILIQFLIIYLLLFSFIFFLSFSSENFLLSLFKSFSLQKNQFLDSFLISHQLLLYDLKYQNNLLKRTLILFKYSNQFFSNYFIVFSFIILLPIGIQKIQGTIFPNPSSLPSSSSISFSSNSSSSSYYYYID